MIRIPSGDGKPKAIRKAVKKKLDAAFGNSRWDTDMLATARHPFAVNPNPDLEAMARERDWTSISPETPALTHFIARVVCNESL